jgi:hypothetical protein
VTHLVKVSVLCRQLHLSQYQRKEWELMMICRYPKNLRVRLTYKMSPREAKSMKYPEWYKRMLLIGITVTNSKLYLKRLKVCRGLSVKFANRFSHCRNKLYRFIQLQYHKEVMSFNKERDWSIYLCKMSIEWPHPLRGFTTWS